MQRQSNLLVDSKINSRINSIIFNILQIMATETTKRNSQQEFWYISTDYSRWTTNIWGCRNISDSKIDQSRDDGVIEKKITIKTTNCCHLFCFLSSFILLSNCNHNKWFKLIQIVTNNNWSMLMIMINNMIRIWNTNHCLIHYFIQLQIIYVKMNFLSPPTTTI